MTAGRVRVELLGGIYAVRSARTNTRRLARTSAASPTRKRSGKDDGTGLRTPCQARRRKAVEESSASQPMHNSVTSSCFPLKPFPPLFGPIPAQYSNGSEPPSAAPAAAPKSDAVHDLNAKQKKDRAQQVAAHSSPEVICNQCSACCVQPKGKSEEEKEKDKSLDLLYRRSWWATTIGVPVAIGGIALLVVQSLTASRSAKAAQVSAEAVISSERPWIASVMGTLPEPKPILAGGPLEVVHFGPSFEHFGKTPP